MPTIDPANTQRRTALQLIQTAFGELGMPIPGSLSATDDLTVQMLYLSNGLGSRMARLPFWSELVEEFTVVTDGSQYYPLPLDWGVPSIGAIWDRTARWPLVGPVTPAEWQLLESGIGQAAPRYRFRYKDGQIWFHVAPEVGITIVQEYLSTGWVLGLSGSLATQRKPRISADSDYVLLDEEMFITGCKLMWLEAKGLDSSKALSEFSTMLEVGWSNSSGAPTLSLVPSQASILLGYANVPDTGYGA